MFNPDLKKLLKDCNSRYSLVVGVAKRAREIRDEAIKNEVLLDEKCVSTAINDIYDGKFIVEEPEVIHSQDKKDEKKASADSVENKSDNSDENE